MQSHRRLPALALALMISGVVGGCRRQSAPQPSPQASPSGEAAPPTATDTIAAADAARIAAEREREAAERLARETRERRLAALTEPIHFEFDRSDLSEVARRALDAKLDVMRVDPSLHIRIEGHTDERGSDEYNIALGMRRASAVRRYLTQNGIASNRVEVISEGEERPLCQDDNESCWARNRRAEFAISAP